MLSKVDGIEHGCYFCIDGYLKTKLVEALGMTPNKFQDFLTKQTQKKTVEEQVDWEEIKNEWVARANEFVSRAKEYLTGFEGVETKVVNVRMMEDRLGEYVAPKLCIELPNELVELVPIGTMLIGAHGRFDLKGLAGTVKWVLVPEGADKPTIRVSIGDDKRKVVESKENEKLAWKLATPPPHIRYLPFDKDIFLEAIMEVSHG